MVQIGGPPLCERKIGTLVWLSMHTIVYFMCTDDLFYVIVVRSLGAFSGGIISVPCGSTRDTFVEG